MHEYRQEWHGVEALPVGGRSSVVSDVASDLRMRADVLGDEIAGRIASRLPQLPYDDSLVSSCCVNVRLGFTMLRDGVPGVHAAPPPEARRYAHELARRGNDKGVLLDAYRIGCASLWRQWSCSVAEQVLEPRDLLTVFDVSTTFMLGYYEALSRRIAREYALERDGDGEAASARRIDVTKALLNGAPFDLDAASRSLGYPLRGHHLGLAIQIDPGAGVDQERKTEAVVAELRRRACADSSLLVREGPEVWAWLGHWEPLDADALSGLAQGLARRAGVRFGLGEPGAGLDGIRRTHAEAREALRVATLGGRPDSHLTRYGRVAVESLLSADPERARHFVRQTLGELAAPDDATRRLRATLRIFFEEGSNRASTARRLNLHHNTVAYRIRRAEELLGQPIENVRLELEVALALAYAFGEHAADS